MVDAAESHCDTEGFRVKEEAETRGSWNKTPECRLDGVCEHINSIQKVPSHHCRARWAKE